MHRNDDPPREEFAEDNDHVREAFADYGSPHDLYRSAYEDTACGRPSIGLTVRYWVNEADFAGNWYEKDVTRSLYCDELRKLGSWDDIDKAGYLIEMIHVSSIVEGVDRETGSHNLPTRYEQVELRLEPGVSTVHEQIAKAFWRAVAEVDNEASEIWNQTHGCPTCGSHWVGDPDDWSEDDWEIGETPVWSECPECDGDGEII